MSKLSEGFDFSKPKDFKKIEELPEKKKDFIINEAREFSDKIKEKVEQKKAKDYQEAEKILAKEDVSDILETIKTVKEIVSIDHISYKEETWERSKERLNEKFPEEWLEKALKAKEELGNICYHIRSSLETYEKIKAGKGESDRYETIPDVKSVIFNDLLEHKISEHPKHWLLSGFKWQNAIQTLSFKEGLDFLNKNKVENDDVSTSFFDIKVTPSNLEEFLNSEISLYVDPNHMLEKIIKIGAKKKTIEIILNKYGEYIDFEKHPIYGESSIFKKFEDKAEKEQKAVDFIVDKVITRLEERLKEVRDERNRTTWRSYTSGYSVESLRKPVEILKNAAKNGVLVKNYEEYLTRIAKLKPFLETYASFVAQSLEKDLSDIEDLLDKMSGKKVENVKKNGLDFVHGKLGVGAEKVYLNGKFIFSVPSGSVFSQNPTNGKVVAYLTKEITDSDYIKGVQNKDVIYAWKDGWDEPKEVFEDHSYSKERYFRILPPEVTSDGKIKFTRISGEETIKEELEIS